MRNESERNAEIYSLDVKNKSNDTYYNRGKYVAYIAIHGHGGLTIPWNTIFQWPIFGFIISEAIRNNGIKLHWCEVSNMFQTIMDNTCTQCKY